jgi:hypothetical protein
MSGIKGSRNRPKVAKNLRGSSKTKRYKANTEAQLAYHAKILKRRSKEKARKARKSR